ncbi:hypothetical protein AC249_AIPGENE15690 [Exaiptasia diaphana]|nr:hypothetical protein AC249_AIPGENE15690 [Exaiptasia diaphana]
MFLKFGVRLIYESGLYMGKYGFSLPKKKEKKEKKEKKTKKKKDKDKANSSHSSNSQGSPEHQENGPVESPVSEGSEMVSIVPQRKGEEMAHEYRDEEPRRIQVTIKPVDDQVSQTASADEIKKITESMSLSSPASMRRNLSSSSGLSDGFRPRAATENTKTSNAVKFRSRSSDDLLDINFSNKSIVSPGSDSSLSTSVMSADATKSDTTTINNLSTFDSFTKLDPLSTSSPAAVTSLGNDKGDNHDDDDIPPVLPKKKGSFIVINDDMNTPPPLPAKRDGAAGLLSSPADSKVSLNNNNTTEAPKPPLPLLNKPPTRSATTSSALARPRPQGTQKKASIVLNTQTPPNQSSGMSYSEELFSFMSDLDFSSATNPQQTKDSQDGSPKTPKTPSRVSYVGSVAVTSETSSSTSSTLSRASTSSTLQDDVERLDSTGGLIRSKTVGAMPSVPPRNKEDILPIAVAFIESVNAFFRGNDYKG